MHELGEPLSLALRRYQVGRPGPASPPRPPGVILFDRKGDMLGISSEADAWLVSLADSWEHGASAADVIRVVLEVAGAAAGRCASPAVCRVRLPDGAWLVVSGSCVDAGDVHVAVVLQAGDIGSVAPAFGVWCGLTSKETEVLPLLAAGLPAKQMARRMSISVLTLNGHLRSIYRKADVRGRDELLALLC